MNPDIVKVLLLGRLVSFMLVVYVGFGLLVEWRSRREGSKLKAFGRLLCRPLVYPVARFSPGGHALHHHPPADRDRRSRRLDRLHRRERGIDLPGLMQPPSPPSLSHRCLAAARRLRP